MFLVLKSMGVVKSILKVVDASLNVFPVWMYGQAGQFAFPHFDMPVRILLGLDAGFGGTLALMSFDLRFGATL